MFLQMGVGFLLIWILNWSWVIHEVLSYTPGWQNKLGDGDEIMSNFIANAPFERILMIKNIAIMNPLLFITGLVLLFI